MTNDERIQKQKELIEEIGCQFDKEGLQPIAGRIIGLLMIMDKERFTFDEITEELQISKSSASIVLRNLEMRGSIEYVTLPGDRKRYFQLKQQSSFQIIDEFKNKLSSYQKMFEVIYNLKADKETAMSVFLKQKAQMLKLFVDSIDKIDNEIKANDVTN